MKSKLLKKILDKKNLQEQILIQKQEGKKIVFTNGCFDILHLGHLDLLQTAAGFGDILIVGLNSDSSIKKIKGEKRPINNQQTRTELLASLFYIDFVVLFEEETPEKLIKIIQPDTIVKGGDYKKSNIVGASFVEEYGGTVEIIPLKKGLSSTNIIQKILEQN